MCLEPPFSHLDKSSNANKALKIEVLIKFYVRQRTLRDNGPSHVFLCLKHTYIYSDPKKILTNFFSPYESHL